MSADQLHASGPQDADELVAMGVCMQATGIGFGANGAEGSIDLVSMGLSMQAAGQALAEAGRQAGQYPNADARIQIGPLDV